MVTFKPPAVISALNLLPSAKVIFNTGIFTSLPDAEDTMGKISPAALLKMITAIAPFNCAFNALSEKGQVPRSITAIFPVKSLST